MYTRCGGCKKKIDFGTKLCDSCRAKFRKKNGNGFKDKRIEATTKSARWQSLRAEIIRRDKGLCRCCLKQGYLQYKRLDVHHLIKRTRDESLIYEPDNLVTVCYWCHKQLENLPLKEQMMLVGEHPKIEEYNLL